MKSCSKRFVENSENDMMADLPFSTPTEIPQPTETNGEVNADAPADEQTPNENQTDAGAGSLEIGDADDDAAGQRSLTDWGVGE